MNSGIRQQKGVLPLVILVSAAFLAATLPSDGADFSSWLYKWKIEFPGYTRSEHLTNFPALLVLGTNNPDFAYDQFESDDGEDLRFTRSDETTELYYEVEEWNTNGLSCVWVQVPELTSNAHIFAYWGMSGASSPSYTTNGATWSEGYAGVWHMTEADAQDSTSHENDGIHGGDVVPEENGKIDGAAAFSGANPHVNLGSDSSLNIPGDLTLHMWMRLDDYTQSRALLTWANSQTAYPFHWAVTASGIIRLNQTGPGFVDSAGTVATSRWTLVTTTRRGSDAAFYFDGALDATRTLSGGVSSGDGYLTMSRSGSLPFHGIMDEVRISSVARSPSWIRAAWLNAASNDVFCQAGPHKGISIDGTTPTEGNVGLSDAVFPVTLSLIEDDDVTVDFSTTNGTAEAGSDYVATNGTLIIPAGQTNAVIIVPIIGDTTYEGVSETFTVRLSNPSNAPLVHAKATGTITEDDAAPLLLINDQAVVEGDSGDEATVTFTVSLSPVSAVDAIVDFTASNGTAEAGSDYVATNGTLVIPAGQPSGTIKVNVPGDDLDEGASEKFFVVLGNPINAAISAGTGQCTVIDDDNPPLLEIGDAAAVEGDGTASNVTFAVSLSEPSGLDVTMDFAAIGGTATAGVDFVNTNGSLVISAGNTNSGILVWINTDNVDEGASESFSVQVSNVVNATVLDGVGTGTIIDDDTAEISINDISIREGNSGTTNADFTVSLSAETEGNVTVQFISSNGTALAGTDYVATNGTLTIPAGQTSRTITVLVNGDTDDEPIFEDFSILLSNATNATIDVSEGECTIIDDDGPTPSASIDDVTLTEQDSGSSFMTFTVELSVETAWQVTIDYETSNGTAIANDDYLTSSGTVTIPIGDTAGTIPITMYGDRFDEGLSENYFVRLSNPNNTTLSDDIGIGTISDDDPPPLLSIDDVTLDEGNSGITNAVFDVTMNATSGIDVTVGYITSNGTAEAGTDYAATNGTLTIPAGQTSDEITVQIFGDTKSEGFFENFYVLLRDPTNATISVGDALGTILEDETTPILLIGDTSITEGDSGATNAVFRVDLNIASSTNVTVNYATSNGTAEAGTDYVATNGTLNIPAGSVTGLIVVTVNGDKIDEGVSERFFVNLGNATNAFLSDEQARGTIIDDDEPFLSIGDAVVVEGDSGTTECVFTVTLDIQGVQNVMVNFTTLDSVAEAGIDYTATNGTLTIPAGQTNGTIAVPVLGETLFEGSGESFFVILSGPVNAHLNDNLGFGTITDDDTPPALRIGDGAATEVDAGNTNALVSVNLSTNAGVDVTVQYETSNGTALAGGDYLVTNGTLMIPAGQTNVHIAVAIVGDTTLEAPEVFYIHVSNAMNASISNAMGTVTITDNDPAPGISVSDATILEGDYGTTNVSLVISLAVLSGLEADVDYATSNGTAEAGVDFVGTNGTVSIPAGQSNTTIIVTVLGDILYEGVSESFFVNLDNASNATITAVSGTGTITDDDPPPGVSIHGASVTEGDLGTTGIVFSVTLSTNVGTAVIIGYSSSNGTAEAGTDYVATNGTLTIPAGQTNGTIEAIVLGETLYEGSGEFFFMNLISVTNGTSAVARATGTIVDDDTPPALSIGDATVIERDTGHTNAGFTVTMSTNAGIDVTVHYVTSNGTAEAAADYVATNGTLTIPAGQTSGVAVVQVIGDSIFEGASEFFLAQLLNASNATITGDTGTGTITDDDAPPGLTIHDTSILEIDAGTTTAVFTASLGAAAEVDVSADFATSNGTAEAGTDYVATNGTLSIPAGQTNTTIGVTIIGDTTFEGLSEEFYLGVNNASNATIFVPTGTCTIVENEPAPFVSISDATVTERDTGITNAVFDVTLNAASVLPLTLTYVSSNGSAKAGIDYMATNRTITIPAGQTNDTIIVNVLSDKIYEGPAESFFVNITNVVDGLIADGSGRGTILENEPAPEIRIHDATVTEVDTGTTNAIFGVSLSTNVTIAVTAEFTTTNGTAQAGADYTATNGMITIPPGQTNTTITVTILGDDVYEGPSESFSVTLSSVSNAAPVVTVAAGTILEDESLPGIAIDDVVVTEGDSGSTNVDVTVHLDQVSDLETTVDYATSNGTAEAGTDYSSTNGTLTIPAGQTTGTVTVIYHGDTIYEGATESFFVVLGNPTNAGLTDGFGEVIITENEIAPDLWISGTSLTEGDSGTTNVEFVVTISKQISTAAKAAYTTSNGTATAGADFIATNGVLSIPAGQTNGTIVVTVIRETLFEGVSESFFVVLTNVVSATPTNQIAEGTILDDDTAPLLWIDNPKVLETDDGSTATAEFTVTLNTNAGIEVTVDFVTSNGTAMAGLDYTATNGTLAIAPGQTNGTIAVLVTGDDTDEGASENFFLHLSNAVNATVTDNEGEGEILDDDDPPFLQISDPLVTEGDTGNTSAVFTVSLFIPSGLDVAVDYATSNGTADAGADYLATNGVLQIPAGVASTTLTVTVLGDVLDEGVSEVFHVNLGNPTNAQVAGAVETGDGIILDDDVPQVSVSPAGILEIDVGNVDLEFPVTLSVESVLDIGVSFDTSDGTAVAGADYVATNGILIVPAGVTNGTIVVPVIGDSLYEGTSEDFSLEVLSASNGVVATPLVQGTITDDETPPLLWVTDTTLVEQNTGTNLTTFVVSISDASGVDASVAFATSNSTAEAGSDYIPTNGTLVIPAGSVTGVVAVAVLADVVDEGAFEKFLLLLSSASEAIITDNEAEGTIIDDDTTPLLSIGGALVVEGNTGTNQADFTVTMSAVAGADVTVGFSTSNGTATASSDYLATNGTLTISAGDVEATISVLIKGDTADEGDFEKFFVVLDNPTNAAIATGVGEGTIIDDDSTPLLSINDISVQEGESGATNAVFTVSLTAPGEVDVGVDYATSNGTATASVDYAPTNGTLTIPAGSVTGAIVTVIYGDVLGEGVSENFFVNLSNPSNALILDARGRCTIIDDAPFVRIDDVNVQEGDSGTSNLVFTVSLSDVSAQEIAVDFATSNGTASGGADYATTNGLLVIPAGGTNGMIAVPVYGDVLYEGVSEGFFMRIGNAVNATIVDSVGIGTINDDEIPPLTWIGDVSVFETDGSPTNASFTVTLSEVAGIDVTVGFQTSNGTAEAGVDFIATNGTLLIPAGDDEGMINVPVIGDVLDENDTEAFFVQMVNASNTTIVGDLGEGTIIDNDLAPLISIDNVLQEEGDSGTSVAEFTVSLSRPSALEVTVGYTTSNGTAEAGLDYVAAGGVLSITPGESEGTINVTVNGDTLDEGASEDFHVTLANPTNASIAVGNGLGTIVDDDEDAPLLWIDDVTVQEGDSGTTVAVFRVTLSSTTGQDVAVSYLTSNGTATAGSDYVNKIGTLVILAGGTNETIPVTVNGDTSDEGALENFFVHLYNPIDAVIADGIGEGTIIDDDTPFISISDVTVTEPDVGITGAVFTVSLSSPPETAVTIDFITSNGTAEAGSDYVFTNGTLTIPIGNTNGTVAVSVLGDMLYEGPSENFYLLLTNAQHGALVPGSDIGEGRITENEPAPLMWIGDPTVVEGDGGMSNAMFMLTLSAPAGIDVTVNFDTIDGSAVAGMDYTNVSGTFLFPAGVATGIVNVGVFGDLLDEGASEDFFVWLSNSVHAVIADPSGKCTVIDDDNTPLLSVSGILAAEGDTGTTGALFTVALSAVSGLDVTVDYGTLDGTAVAGADYLATNGNLTIPAGSPTGTISVTVLGDRLDEGASESFFLALSNAVNGTVIGGPAEGAIEDDDDPPFLWIDDVTIKEGESGTTSAVFTVTLSTTSGLPASVEYSTSNGTALAGSDYIATNGTLAIPAGSVSGTITVHVYGDAIKEGVLERFYVNLSNAVSAIVVDSVGKGTIIDDVPPLWIADVSLAEGDAGTVDALFSVTMGVASDSEVTVDFATSNGTATAGTDFVAANGTLTIPIGDMTGTIAVAVMGDLLHEGVSENFFVVLDNAANAVPVDEIGEATVNDDDDPPSVWIGDVTVVEEDSGTTGIVFTVTLSDVSGLDAGLAYSTSNGTATASSDYVATNGYIVIDAGDTNGQLSVLVNGDVLDEGDFESFFVVLVGQSNATISVGAAEGRIIDDDAPPHLAIGDVMKTEGDSGVSYALFQLTLSAPSGLEVYADYATLNGTATAGSDYLATNGTFMIPSGVDTGILQVAVVGDVFDEGGFEKFEVNLSNASNATLVSATGDGTIIDDDEALPLLWINDATIVERDSGTTTTTFRVSLSAVSATDVGVEYQTSDGTAESGSDYQTTLGLLIIPAGQPGGDIPVNVYGDTAYEGPSEYFSVTLSNPSNATLVAANGEGTIIDDDEAPIWDADGDGMADTFEDKHFGGTNEPMGGAYEDWDGDFFVNLFEHIAGTIPTNPASYLGVTSVETGSVVVTWDSVTGRQYWVEMTESMLPSLWTNVPEPGYMGTWGTGLEIIYTNVAPPEDEAFYRIRVEFPTP